MCENIHVLLHVLLYACVYLGIYLCLYICGLCVGYVCMHVPTYVPTYVPIYLHTYIHHGYILYTLLSTQTLSRSILTMTRRGAIKGTFQPSGDGASLPPHERYPASQDFPVSLGRCYVEQNMYATSSGGIVEHVFEFI